MANGAVSAPSDKNLITSDVTTNNASTTKHGFLPKLSGSSSDVLKGDGSFGSPPASGAWTQIGTAQLGSSAALIIDTSSISTNYDVFRITVYTVLDGSTGGGVNPSLRLNADSGTNYNLSFLTQYNGTAIAVSSLTGESKIGLMYNQTMGQNDTMITNITIGKSLTSKHAQILIESSMTKVADGRYVKSIISGSWENTSAKINEIAIGWFTDSTTYMGAGSWAIIEGATI